MAYLEQITPPQLGKTLIFKDTTVYSDPITQRKIATVKKGRVLDTIGEIFGWISVIYAAPLKTGYVKSSDAVVEKDVMQINLESTRPIEVRSGPDDSFSVVTTLSPGSMAIGFQEANNYYRIGLQRWAKKDAFRQAAGPPIVPKVAGIPWTPIIIGGVSVLAIGGLSRLIKKRGIKRTMPYLISVLVVGCGVGLFFLLKRGGPRGK